MPFHLPPISRRRFLSRTLTAGAGLALAPNLLAATKPVDQDSWAFLSDINIAADRTKLGRGINMADHFKTVSDEVRGLPKSPAGVLITGDCAFNSGEPADYKTVAELLDPLRHDGLPIHLLLGNHDQREHFWDAFPEEKQSARPLADRQVALMRTPRANWFILDSLEQTLSTPGLLGPEQLDWLGKALDANADKPALVLIHHNPGIQGGNMGLKDSLALFEVIRPRKQVKAYFFGHTHHWEIAKDESGIHLINLPPVSYLFHDGDPAGWVHANLEDKAVQLELRCIDKTHKAHGQQVELAWR
ncbi:MAG TPA: metallophosphoesterase [Candidatus Dormibacteraeota bacterium]|nr:metallophosphoesterase [Candidatus Dormibacteraeota bacterium]